MANVCKKNYRRIIKFKYFTLHLTKLFVCVIEELQLLISFIFNHTLRIIHLDRGNVQYDIKIRSYHNVILLKVDRQRY